jgi:hypothetical protein
MFKLEEGYDLFCSTCRNILQIVIVAEDKWRERETGGNFEVGSSGGWGACDVLVKANGANQDWGKSWRTFAEVDGISFTRCDCVWRDYQKKLSQPHRCSDINKTTPTDASDKQQRNRTINEQKLRCERYILTGGGGSGAWRRLSSGLLRRLVSDDGGSKHLWNVRKFLPGCNALQTRRQPSAKNWGIEVPIVYTRYIFIYQDFSSNLELVKRNDSWTLRERLPSYI